MLIKKTVTISVLLLAAACAPQAALVKTRTELSDVRTGTRAVETSVQDLQKRLAAIEKRLAAVEASSKSAGDVEKAVPMQSARFDPTQQTSS
jgi:septal ring factor EnvC (AmiA/AmiB activator)